MRTWTLASAFAISLLFSVYAASYAQEVPDHVVINEVDINPAGDDSKSISEWVELYNPTSEDVDIGGWKIASTTVTKKTLTLPIGTKIKAGQFLVYSYSSLWFTDVSEKIQLRDKSGQTIDETPVITDQKNDFSSWQRKFDGVDSDTSNDWILRTSSAGSSNGKLDAKSADKAELVISIKTDSRLYVFGETAIISGNVTERIYQEKPYFTQEQITLEISGPGKFTQTKTLYPDLNLQFKTQVKLDKVLGVSAGTYRISVEYGGAKDGSIFVVGEQKTSAILEEESELTISTDKDTYIPGQRVAISASTTKTIPLAGLEYGVYDPNGIRVFSGKLYPSSKGEFSTSIDMTTVKPVYGTYDIIADYGKQHAEATFVLTKDVKDTEKIVLVTDKKVYGPGEPVTISGRSNKFVAALDLEVLQTGVTAIGKQTNNVYSIRDQVKLAGDSTFEYKLQIPSDQLRYGDYRVTVSKEFGKSVTYFTIIENPDEYTVTEEKEFVATDKSSYTSGEKLTIAGHVIPKERSSFEAIPVKISIEDETGKPLSILAIDKKLRTREGNPITATYSFTALPDVAGNYKIETSVNPSSFKPGAYVIKASYDRNVVSTMFSVSSGLDLSRNINAALDKNIYGLGETVKLEGTLNTGQSAVKITLTKPDGRTVNAGSKVDNGKFSWSWTAPKQDYNLGEIRDPRAPRPSVFGNYKITIIATSETADVFFKLSKDPENDTFEIKPLEVTTDKPVYKAGERLIVSGNTIKRQTTTLSSGGQIPDRVNIEVKSMNNKKIYDGTLAFDNRGYFQSIYELPQTIFKDGKYKVTAIYQKLRAETTFEVKNPLQVASGDKLTLTLSTDKEEYLAGETVQIYGTTNKVIFLTTLDLVVVPEEDTKINCGTFYCGLGGKKIDLSRYYLDGIYSYDYKIPSSAKTGTYVISVDTDFGTFTKTFKIVDKSTITLKPAGKISEKFNRITDSVLEIGLFAQNIEDQTVAPHTVLGYVVTSRGSENLVNLKITADDGQCIIGQEEDCLVSESAKSKTVTIAGINYKVTYSGPEPVLEKFSIVPESEEDLIPDSIWTVEIIKNDQPTKFYYEIIYKPIQ
jgi:hypothetical protein